MTPARALLWVALGACFISFAGPLTRLSTLPPTTSAAWRMSIAAATLWLLAVARRQLPSREVDRRRAGAFAILAGLAFAGDLFVWHRSIPAVGAGVATLLLSTQVFAVAVLSRVLLREHVRAALWLLAVTAVGGVALLSGAAGGRALDPVGLALGLLTGVFYAAYYLCLRHSQSVPGALPPIPNLALSASVAAAGLVALAGLTGEDLQTLPGRDLVIVLVLGVVIHVGGWLSAQHGMTHVPAARGSLVLLLQPALAVVWGWWLLGEALSALQLMGVLVTLCSVVGATLLRSNQGGRRV
ncbi:MAG: DMT family transporter [Deltaproteobacteria bacterium]|nr:DMT family transporter [Deltaproteobacteria bacterium]